MPGLLSPGRIDFVLDSTAVSPSWFAKLLEGHAMILGFDMLILGRLRESLVIVDLCYTLAEAYQRQKEKDPWSNR
jgi:hypothetical protein